MKKDDLFMQEALGYMDPGLLEESENVMGKKRRPAPVRALMAAACICALLVAGAVAAELLEFDFVRIFGEQDEEKTIHGMEMNDDGELETIEKDLLYRVDGSQMGLVSIPVEVLSPALQEVQEQYPEGWLSKNWGVDSWTEAEEFIGCDLADNAVLDQVPVEKYVQTTFGSGDQAVTGNCIVMAYVDDGTLHSVYLWARYNMHFLRDDDKVTVREWRLVTAGARGDGTKDTAGATVTVNATFYTGELPESPGSGFVGNDYYTAEEQESYLTANGLETVIVHLKEVPGEDGDREGGAYHASFALRGGMFTVQVAYHNAETKELVLIGLKQILDAYQ